MSPKIITCATCEMNISDMGELTDHIVETNKGIQGDIEVEQPHTLTPEEIPHFMDNVRGYAHLNYFYEDRTLVSPQATNMLFTPVTEGMKRCFECGQDFFNDYRRIEHIINSGHCKEKDMMYQFDSAMHEMERYDKFRRIIFDGEPVDKFQF